MPKRKLTSKILEHIEELAEMTDYTLQDIREEADITKALMEDTQVINAIERGRVKWFIELASNNGDIDAFTHYSGKSHNEINQMFETYKEAIEKKKNEIKSDKQRTQVWQASNSALTLNAARLCGNNIYVTHQEEIRERIDREALASEISKTVTKIQNGDTTALLEMLVGNVTQLNVFNSVITGALQDDIAKPIENFNKLSNMQLKLMQEQRKSIMAINEITNPKRTTFVKEVSLHQNSKKIYENQNKLSQSKEEDIIDAHQYTEAETVTARED